MNAKRSKVSLRANTELAVAQGWLKLAEPETKKPRLRELNRPRLRETRGYNTLSIATRKDIYRKVNAGEVVSIKEYAKELGVSLGRIYEIAKEHDKYGDIDLSITPTQASLDFAGYILDRYRNNSHGNILKLAIELEQHGFKPKQQ
jgi:hypothetical protein